MDLWITSLLPTGPTAYAVDMWTTSLLPTSPQPCNRSTKEPREVLESI